MHNRLWIFYPRHQHTNLSQCIPRVCISFIHLLQKRKSHNLVFPWGTLVSFWWLQGEISLTFAWTYSTYLHYMLDQTLWERDISMNQWVLCIMLDQYHLNLSPSLIVVLVQVVLKLYCNPPSQIFWVSHLYICFGASLSLTTLVEFNTKEVWYVV